MKKCEAINSFGIKAGEQCGEPAKELREGRCVCWAHARALENKRRTQPVTFVAAIPWQKSA